MSETSKTKEMQAKLNLAKTFINSIELPNAGDEEASHVTVGSTKDKIRVARRMLQEISNGLYDMLNEQYRDMF